MNLYANGANYYLMIHQNRRGFPYLLLFHGFMGSSIAMEPLAQLLTRCCNPVTIDLLGHGQTSNQANPDRFSVKHQVNDLHSILDRLQLQKLFLYGYSMGGRLAQHLALSDPSRISGLILESTHCGISDEGERRKRAENDDQLASKIESDFTSFTDQWIQLPLFKSPESATDFDYTSIIRKQDPGQMAAVLRGFGTGVMPPVCDQFGNIELPIQLIAGKTDQKYVDKMSEMAHLCTYSVLNIIEGAGHRVHADQPEQTAKCITQFLDKNG